jgi:hypothetical protein
MKPCQRRAYRIWWGFLHGLNLMTLRPLNPDAPKFIGIVGSRRRATQKDYDLIVRALDSIYNPGDWIVSGGCPTGADAFAEMIAHERSIPILIYYADWNKHGRAAGPIRNVDIARASDVLIALPALDRTGGTESTIKSAYRFSKRVILT